MKLQINLLNVSHQSVLLEFALQGKLPAVELIKNDKVYLVSQDQRIEINSYEKLKLSERKAVTRICKVLSALNLSAGNQPGLGPVRALLVELITADQDGSLPSAVLPLIHVLSAHTRIDENKIISEYYKNYLGNQTVMESLHMIQAAKWLEVGPPDHASDKHPVWKYYLLLSKGEIIQSGE